MTPSSNDMVDVTEADADASTGIVDVYMIDSKAPAGLVLGYYLMPDLKVSIPMS